MAERKIVVTPDCLEPPSAESTETCTAHDVCAGTTGRTPVLTWTPPALSVNTEDTLSWFTRPRTSPSAELVLMVWAGNHFKNGFTTMNSGYINV